MTPGQLVINGQGIFCSTFGTGVELTVVRQSAGYSVTKYTVRDQYGRHGFAYSR